MYLKAFFTKTTLWSVAAFCLLVGVFVYATIDRTVYVTEQLVVIPDMAVSDTWMGVENILISDIAGDSLYQEFAPSNAAVLDQDLMNTNQSESSGGVSEPESNVQGGETTEATSTEEVEINETETESSPAETEPSNESPVVEPEVIEEEVVEEPVEEPEVIEEPEPEPEPEPVEEPEPEPAAEEVSLQINSPYWGLLPVSTGTYRLTQETTSEEVTEESEGTPTPTIEPEPEPEPEVVEEPVEEQEPVTPVEPEPVVEEAVEEQDQQPENEEVEAPTEEASPETEVDSSTDEQTEEETTEESEQGENEEVVEEEVFEEDEEVMDDEEIVTTIYDACAGNEECKLYSTTFTGFSVPEFEEGKFLASAQLRLSLAAKTKASYSEGPQRFVVEYSYETTGEWRTATVIDIEDEIANSINGDYFLVSLDKPLGQADLANLQVRVSYQGDIKDLDRAYIESLWLEVTSASFYEETDPMYLSGAIDYSRELESPKFHDLNNADMDPAMSELPSFTLSYSPQENFIKRAFTAVFSENQYIVDSVRIIDARGDVVVVPVDVEYHDDKTWTVQFLQQPQKMIPGKYTVELVVDENETLYTDSFEFYWGVLAVNTTKSMYFENEDVTLNLAALTEKGDTICDAALLLKVIDPTYTIHEIPVEQSGACGKNNVTDIPDYLAYFNETSELGQYTIQLQHLNREGEVVHSIQDHFEVRDYIPYDIERTAPTRIYPLAPYDVTLSIEANRIFTGDIVERVPRGFTFTETSGAEVVTMPEYTELVWRNVSLEEGDTIELSYQFDAPDISPYMYLLGPLNMDGFEELRQWQIASDALTAIASFSGTRTVASTNLNQAASPLQWSGSSIDPFYFDHSTTTDSHLVTLRQAGDYFLSVNLPQQRTDGNSSRTRVGVEVRVNGVVIPEGVGRSAYIRNFSGHAESSSYVSFLLRDINPDDVVQVMAEGLTTVDAGDIVNVTGEAALMLEYIGTGAGVFAATTTQTTNSTNLNQITAYPLEWTETRQDSGFVHSDAINPEQIIISDPGLYHVTINVPLTNNIAQTNVRGEVLLDGVLVPGGVFSQGYAQNSGTEDDGDSSIHWSGVVETTAVNQVLSVTAEREARAGTVTVTSGFYGSIFVRELPVDDVLVLRGTNLVGGTNWNPAAAAAVQWVTEDQKDAAVFTHSTVTNPQEITVNEDGDYYLSFNDAVAAGIARSNNRIEVLRNGTPISGAQSKAHYIRNQQGHTESSTALSVILEGLLSGDVITVTTQQEAAGGTANDATDAVLMMWKKDTINLRPEAPATTVPFDNIRFASSTPYFDFTASDPDGTSALEYEFSIATSTGFTASTTFNSSVDSEFFNTASSTDTSPFAEANTIRLQLTSGDELNDQTTYYWRVRARDVTGSGEFSDWSTTKSLTVDMAAAAPSWFQSYSGQFEGNSLIGTVSSGDDRVEVDASISSEILIAYGEGTNTSPRYRLWNGATWGVEGSALAVTGTINWVQTAAGITRDEYALITLDSASDSFVQIYSASTSSWGNQVLMSNSVVSPAYRGVAVRYESVSGDLMAVSCTNSPDPVYRVWDGTSWSAATSIPVSSLNNCNFVELAADPASDELILVVRDTGSQYEALVWNGSAWVESRVIGSSAKLAREGMSVVYESSGDQAIIAVSNNTLNSIQYTTWNGVEFSTNAIQALGNDFEFGLLTADPNSDNVALCYIDEDNDIGVLRWNGGVWATFTELETSGNGDTGRPVSCEFETVAGRSGYLMAAYSDTANVRYRAGTSTVYSTEATIGTMQDSFWVRTTRAGDGTIVAVALDDVSDNLNSSFWNGTSWSAEDVLETSLSSVIATPYEMYDMSAKKFQFAEGIIQTPPINFTDVPNQPTWGDINFSTTEPFGTDVKVRVKYSNVGTCDAYIPDLALAGNSAGFDVTDSPIDLVSVSTTTYDQICLEATLTTLGDFSASLEEWTLAWVRQPKLTQNRYRWYVNGSLLTPTDPWPVGVDDTAENTSIDSSIAVNNNEEIRLRMSLQGDNVELPAFAEAFKLQYAEGFTCSNSLEWHDVGGPASTTALWRGFENSIVGDDWYAGGWDKRIKITTQGSVTEASVTDFPVYVNLADLPSGFFDDVKSDGGDIRITEDDGVTEIPYELVSINTGAETGELYFKADLATSTDSEFFIYYGNPSASGYSNSATYGRNNVWTNGYVMVQHLNQSSGSGNFLLDSSGTGSNGAPLGTTPTFESSALIGGGYDFAGNNQQRIETPDSVALRTTSALTASAWARADSWTTPDHNPVLWKGTQIGWGANYLFRIAVSGGTPTWGFTCGTTEGFFAGGAVSLGSWVYYSLTYDGTIGRAYLNGAQVASGGACTGTLNAHVGAPVRSGFGYRQTVSEQTHWDGDVDEIRISNVARSAGWLATEFNNQSNPTGFYAVSEEETISDGRLLPSTVLSTSDVAETYEEENPTRDNQNTLPVGDDAEWDFALHNNGATPATNYCFRMVYEDGALLNSYDNYPRLITNAPPDVPTLVAPFDNERLASTTPWFEFSSDDELEDEIAYEIQVSTDYAFGSTVINNNSLASFALFTNLIQPSEKGQFTSADTIQFISPTALSSGTTYWWRVRAQDPDGSGAYSEWSQPESFTVTTGTTITTWYQTTGEQFATNNLLDAVANAGDTGIDSGFSVATTTSTVIDYDDRDTGNAWGDLSFTDTGAVTYFVEYRVSGETFELIPDGDLSGNSSGFTSSPVSLAGLNPLTYNELRLVAVLTGNSTSPRLQDWSVTWSETIEPPTLVNPFDNAKVATTTPALTFVTSDPEDDDLQYEVQISSAYDFGSPNTFTSGVDSGFTNTEDGVDSSPFTTDEVIQYIVQTPLTNGNTYWWRVRARDPLGTNSWSDYSVQESFTVDTAITTSVWFQTTGEQFETNELIDIETTAGAAQVTSVISEVISVYGEGTGQSPQYRLWNGTSWSIPFSAESVGAQIRWLELKASPARPEYALGTLGTDEDVNFQIYNSETDTWSDIQELQTASVATNKRTFNLAYESQSGDLLAVACDAGDAVYSIWNGTSWSSPTALALTNPNDCEFVQMASDPISDEIIVVFRHAIASANDFEAFVWNGSSFGNAAQFGELAQSAHEGMAVAYEESGGQAIVAVSNGAATTLLYNIWNGTSWSGTATEALGDHIEWASLKADVGTDRLAFCYVDNDGDLGVLIWDGSAWNTFTELDTAGNDVRGRSIDCDWQVGTNDGDLLVAYSDTIGTRYQTYNGTTFSGELDIALVNDTFEVNTVRAGNGLIHLAAYDDALSPDRIDHTRWDGSVWSTRERFSDNASLNNVLPYVGGVSMAAQVYPNFVSGFIRSTPIAFEDGTGPRWDIVTWNDTTPGASQILYRVYYESAPDEFSLVPDVDLPGNSAGFTTSPIDISNVDRTIYSVLKLEAEFECVSGDCPTLQDWSLAWSEGITMSGIAREFDGIATTTSGTVGVAVNGVLQVGKTGTIQADGTWSIDNVTAFPGDTLVAFVQGAADADEAIGIATYDGVGNVTGVELNKRHVTVGYSNVSTTTIAGFVGFDNSDDEDVFFSIGAGNALTVCAESVCADGGIKIKTGTTFRPGAAVTTHDVLTLGTFAPATNTVRVSGAWDIEGTFIPDTSSVIFTATTTPMSGFADWYNGSWLRRVPVTIPASSVNSNLTDFPVHVDLANLGAGFFSTVRADGGDIRVTTSDGETELPREVVDIDTGGSTGELYFEAPLLSASTDTTFYIYFNNATATDYATTDTYGAENVWANNFEVVYHFNEDPSGGAPQYIDSTGNSSGTAVNMEGGDLVTSPAGGAAVVDGVNESIQTNFNNSVTNSTWSVFVNANGTQGACDGLMFSRGTSVSGLNVGGCGDAAELGYHWNDAANSWGFAGGPVYPTSEWFLASMVVEPSQATLYAISTGGVASGANVVAHAASTINNLDFGWDSSGVGRSFNGTLSEARLSSVARSQDWLEATYDNLIDADAFYSVAGIETYSPYAATSDVIFEIDGTLNFYNVTFGETTGSAVWEIDQPMVASGTFAVDRGILDRGTSTIAVSQNFRIGTGGSMSGMATTTFAGTGSHTWIDQSASSTNIGYVVIDGSAKTVTLGTNVTAESVTIGADDTLNASGSGYNINVYRSWVNNNSFVPQSGTVTFVGTTAGTISRGASAFNNLAFTGVGGNWSFTTPTLALNGNLSIATGTVTFPTGTTTIAGSFSNTGGTFLHNNGEVRMTSTAGGRTITQSGTAFLNAFYDLVFTGSGAWSFTEANATTTRNFRIQAGTVTLPSGSITVGGDFNVTGGSFAHNNGEVRLMVNDDRVVRTNGSSLNNVTVTADAGSGWYDTDWSYRKTITVGTSTLASTLTDFPVYVNLADLGSDFFTNVESDGRDIRVVAVSGSGEVPHEVVSIDTGLLTGELHFKAPTLSTSTPTTFYVYYGNPSATAYAADDIYGAQNVWTNNYVAVYHLEEVGTTAVDSYIDSTANEFHAQGGGGTLAQVPSRIASQLGFGQNVAGGNFWIDSNRTAATLGIGGAAAKSISAWAYTTAFSTDGGIFTMGSQVNGQDYSLRTRNGATNGWRAQHWGTDYDFTYTSLNTWVHFALDYDGTVSRTYADGTLVGSATLALNTQNTDPFMIGRWRTTDFFNGYVDEVRVSSVSRSIDWLAAEHSNQASTTSFYTVGGGQNQFARTFTDTNVTILGNVLFESGRVVLPTGTMSVGGSFNNDTIFTANGGTVRFNSTAGAETIDAGASSFATLTFDSATGDFTVTENATATVAVNLTNAQLFTLSSGRTLASQGTFTNAVSGANTTWTGSTLRLASGSAVTLNNKTHAGDVYGTLESASSTLVRMWNSSATTYLTSGSTGAIYSQDHAGVDGDLNIYGNYTRVTGTEHWSYATDFDGTSLTGVERQVDVRVASSSQVTMQGATLSVIGGVSASTTVDAITNSFSLTATSSTLHSNYATFAGTGVSGLSLLGSTTLSTFTNTSFTVVPGRSGITIDASTVDLNPAGQFFNVNFATTTAGAGTNVTLTGAPSSYVWFRNGIGNLYGEAFDAGDGNPGSIRFDNSSFSITISGTVYSDDGITPMGAPICNNVTPVVTVAIDGVASYTGSCNSANGTYSIPNVAYIGDADIVVYLDSNRPGTTTVALRSETSGTGTSNGSGVFTVNKPASVANGDYIVIITGKDDDDAVTGPAGFTGYTLGATTGNLRHTGIWYKRVTDASSEPSTYSFTGDATEVFSYWSGSLMGVSPSNPEDVSFTGRWQQVQNNTAPSAPSQTTLTTNSYVLAAWYVDNDNAVTMPGFPWSTRAANIVSGENNNLSVSSRVMATPGVTGGVAVTGVGATADTSMAQFAFRRDTATTSSVRAATVTKTPTGNITNLDLYQNRIVVRHEDAGPIRISDMTAFDISNDTDVLFNAATGTPNTLVLEPNTELYVFAGKSFAPGGNITLSGNGNSNSYEGTLQIGSGATFTAAGTETHRLAGRFVMATTSNFTAASSTFIFNATTTGKSITSPNTVTFNQLQFAGTGGGWNITAPLIVLADMNVASGTVTGTSNLTLQNGSLYGNGVLSLGSGTTTIARSNTFGGTTAWTLNNLILGNGTVVGTTTPNTSATTTILGRLTVANAHFLDAGATTWDLAGTGTVFVETGTFLEDTSTIRYSGAGANVLSTNYYNLLISAGVGSATYTGVGSGILVLNDLSVGGATNSTFTVNTTDQILTVQGDVTIASNGTFEASNSALFTIQGDLTNDGVLNGNNGTILFNGTGTSNITAGNANLSNVDINGTGNYVVTENATSTGNWSLIAHNNFTVNGGATLAIGGNFLNNIAGGNTTWTGSTLRLFGNGTYEINDSATSDVYETLSVAANTHVRMWNSSAATYDVNALGSLYSQDHAGVDGDAYVYGSMVRTSGDDYWSFDQDFDGNDLSGGSERQAQVYFASGASALWSGTASLSVIGTSTATTTIENQGSGTYGIVIGSGATTEWNIAQIRDINSSGVVFAGTPTVTDFSRTDHLVEINDASAITVGGTAINANEAKNFTNNIFNVGGGATNPKNVTATGTAISSWRFTNHTGNLAGEAFDEDPAGDPGYVVWDDSAALITVSGNVYSDEGVTVSPECDGVTNNVRLVVAGLTTYDTSCNATTGAFSISSVAFSPLDTLTLYLNGETPKAANVSIAPVSSISNMHLYHNRVIVRHENTNPITIADMAVWDSSDDADIPFTAVNAGTDTLSLPADTKLIVWTGKTFEPNGNVTLAGGGAGAAWDGTLEVLANARFRAKGTESHSVGGSVIFGTGAEFVSGSSTLALTTTGSARTFDVNANTLHNLTVSGSGSYLMTDATLTAAGTYAQSAGAVTFPTGTTTIGASFNVTGGSFTNNGSPFVFTGTGAQTVRFNNSQVASLRFNGAGTFTMSDTNATSTGSVVITSGSVTLPSGNFAVGGNFEKRAGTISHNTSEIIMTSATPALLTASSSDLYAVRFTGAGSFTITDQNITFLDSFTVANGSVQMASGTTAIGGSLLATGGTFTHATGTVLLNAPGTGRTINPGANTFHNLQIGAPAGGYTLFSATTTNNFTIASANILTVDPTATVYVGGVFTNSVGGAGTTWTGSTLILDSGTAYSINSRSNNGDVYGTLRIGADTDIRAWYSSASSIVVDASSSLYSQDNANVNGALYIYGDLVLATSTEYWNYATDFDGTALGGSPRAVTVSLAANATTTLQSGTLQIIGADGFETVIQNQGAGTYAMTVTGGTLNAQYYEFGDLNIEGLKLQNTPTITDLSNGLFDLAVDTGSLITLSSTTLNANPSKTFDTVGFTATTGISGFNINLVGETTNAWRITNNYGNIGGEGFDIDGIDACGSIRFDNSACLLTEQTQVRWRADDGGEGAPDSEWFDQTFDYRTSVRILNNDNQAYASTAVKVIVPYDSAMQSDFDDLRFTSNDGQTAVPFWIERFTASSEAQVWVRVPTLPASAQAVVYMYYGSTTAALASNGAATFDVFDDYEDNNITEYSGDTGLFTTVTSPVYGGTYALRPSNTSGRTTDGIFRFDDPVSQGQMIRYMQYVDTGAGSGDEPCTIFGVQSPGTTNQNYAVCLEQFGTDRISIAENVSDNDTSGTVLASSTVSYSTGWYEVEIDWRTNNTITAALYNSAGTLVASTTATDSSYTSGGYGYTFWFQNGAWDSFTARPRVATTPTVYLGAKQQSGGANWISVQNGSGSSIAGDVVRLRVAIENGGLDVTGQQYRLEYAAKAAAPTCESVSSGSYVEVPNQASCGSSPVCMQTSSFVSNGAVTTDLLLNTDGDFSAGAIVTSPQNETSGLDVDQDFYTELEYVVTPTVNASDTYCLRVTNAGTPLDFYAKIAELGLQFDPTFGAVDLNAGLPISLTPGTTTPVTVLGTVSDFNGFTDITNATATIYRSGAGAACTPDNNNCYVASTENGMCTFTNCSGSSCDLSCTVDIFFHADPTDADTYEGEEWLAFAEAEDFSGGYDFASAPGVELNTLRALAVDSIINYGALAADSDTGSFNPTTTVTNLGNVPINIDIEGNDLTDGASSQITADNQKVATSTFTYSACVSCQQLSTSTPVTLGINLSKPNVTTPPVETEVYWGIAVPFTASNAAHTGTNIFTAIGVD